MGVRQKPHRSLAHFGLEVLTKKTQSNQLHGGSDLAAVPELVKPLHPTESRISGERKQARLSRPPIKPHLESSLCNWGLPDTVNIPIEATLSHHLSLRREIQNHERGRIQRGSGSTPCSGENMPQRSWHYPRSLWRCNSKTAGWCPSPTQGSWLYKPSCAHPLPSCVLVHLRRPISACSTL